LVKVVILVVAVGVTVIMFVAHNETSEYGVIS
jgi:hypothetical protein